MNFFELFFWFQVNLSYNVQNFLLHSRVIFHKWISCQQNSLLLMKTKNINHFSNIFRINKILSENKAHRINTWSKNQWKHWNFNIITKDDLKLRKHKNGGESGPNTHTR